jgi:ESCRT-I complex subunit TSG101
MSNFSQQISAVDSILYNVRCYRDLQRIRNDILELIKNIPSLQPKMGSLPKGSSQMILYLSGTIPIIYSGNQYNIPIALWITENYPLQPPIVYVTPTPQMIITPRHRHVDSSGFCYLPYLSNWNQSYSNLVDLAYALIKIFSADPPVRAQSSTTHNNQSYSQNFNSYPSQSYISPTNIQQNPYPSQSYISPTFAQPNSNMQNLSKNYSQQNSNQTYPSQQYIVQQPPPTKHFNQPVEDPLVVAKRNVTLKLQAKLHEFNTNCTKEMDEQIVIQNTQEEKSKILDLQKKQLLEEKSFVENDMDNLTKTLSDLSLWIQQNDQIANSLDIDALTEPRDILSKQLLLLVAEDATIEDTLYYLEKKLNNGQIDLDIFLKTVRSLCADQFLKRSTIKKIHEKQRQLIQASQRVQ